VKGPLRGLLVLEDGTVYRGDAIGRSGTSFGEIVFDQSGRHGSRKRASFDPGDHPTIVDSKKDVRPRSIDDDAFGG